MKTKYQKRLERKVKRLIETPRCGECAKLMENYVVNGKVQEHCWVCKCRPKLILSIG